MTNAGKRPGVSARDARVTCAKMAMDQGTPLICLICKQPITPEQMAARGQDGVINEHWTPRGLGGSDDPLSGNRGYVHKPCADKKTHGIDGDIHKVAKTKRIVAKAKGERKRRGPPLKSRGFQKNPDLVRGLDGKVKPRKKK